MSTPKRVHPCHRKRRLTGLAHLDKDAPALGSCDVGHRVGHAPRIAHRSAHDRRLREDRSRARTRSKQGRKRASANEAERKDGSVGHGCKLHRSSQVLRWITTCHAQR